MIQRIQTVWLLLSAVFSLLLLILLINSEIDLLGFVLGAVLPLPLVTIFLYKNRKLQIKLCYIFLVLLVLIVAFYGVVCSYNIITLSPGTGKTGLFLLVGAFLFLSMVCDMMAIRAIKKDEKLVRSLDRLR